MLSLYVSFDPIFKELFCVNMKISLKKVKHKRAANERNSIKLYKVGTNTYIARYCARCNKWFDRGLGMAGSTNQTISA